jgi:imidazolonepropionase-like amidohydrolase
MLRIVNSCGAIVALLLGTTALTHTSMADGQEFVVHNVRIFDGAHVIPSGDVLVQNGIIKAVGPHIKTPQGVTAIDGTGKTLLPGLIDAHVHTMGEVNFLRSALALGVSTELDMGAAPRFADQVERDQAEGKSLELADLRSSRTQPTAPNGHGTEYGLSIPTISSPEEAQALVDALVAEGADFIGEIVYDDGSQYGLRIPTLSKETLRAVIDAAHRRGKLAVVHILSLQGGKDAIAAGADGLVHLFADRPPDDEFLSLVAQHRTFVIPTLSLLASISGVSAGPSLARDPRQEPYMSSEAIADLQTMPPRHAGNLSYAEETVRQLRQKRIPILAGTDAHNPGTAHGASLHGELALLVNSGLTPIEALASATSLPAAAFHLNDRGQIMPGKRADLLLVGGDPTDRISDIDNIVAVWKLGVKVDRESYRVILDKEKEFNRARRQTPPPAGSDSGLISDFENGTTNTKFGLGWIATAGRLMGGSQPTARIDLVGGGAAGGKKALRISGEIADGVFGWAGAMFNPGAAPGAPVNLSGKKAITFWTKGDGRTYQVMLYAKSKGALPAVKSFVAGSDWKKVTIPLSDFGTDGSDMTQLTLAELSVPGRFNFEIDEIRFE